jgi:hypothetical protein
MTWPRATDYHEAMQNPGLVFRDDDLRRGQPALNALGLPQPRSGNFADVYEIRGPGQSWAVKCFTRAVPDLERRYQAVSDFLKRANLSVMVEFRYLNDGIRVAGRWYPVLKMRWIEGFTLNEFVQSHLDQPQALLKLASMWQRLAEGLRAAGLAHGDLQHGNVLLVPGSQAPKLAIRLIDYDGMFVPELAGEPSGEVGHPNYQHPERLRAGTYDAEVDRFPHLVVGTALRALAEHGRGLWDRYDNGDNLLFRETDFAAPGSSPLFQELWHSSEPGLRNLVGHLALAADGPLAAVPLLGDLLAGGSTRTLSFDQARRVQALLARGVVRAVPRQAATSATPPPVARPTRPVRTVSPTPSPAPRSRPLPRRPRPPRPARRRRQSSMALVLMGGLVGCAVVGVMLLIWLRSRPDAMAAGPATRLAGLLGVGSTPPVVDPAAANAPVAAAQPAPTSVFRWASEIRMGSVTDVRVLADSRAVTWSADLTLRVWNATTGREQQRFEYGGKNPGQATCIAVSGDGRWAIVAGRLAWLIDLETGRETEFVDPGRTFGTPQQPNPNEIRCARFRPGRSHAYLGSPGFLGAFDAAKPGNPLSTFGPGYFCYWFDFTPDGSALVYIPSDPSVRPTSAPKLFDLDRGLPRFECAEIGDGAGALAVSPTGDRLVAGTAGGLFCVWDLANGALLWSKRHAERREFVTGVAVSPDGRRALSACNGLLYEWDLATQRSRQLVNAEPVSVVKVAYSPDGRRAVTAGHSGALATWLLPE